MTDWNNIVVPLAEMNHRTDRASRHSESEGRLEYTSNSFTRANPVVVPFNAVETPLRCLYFEEPRMH